jgi:hypothetical protein
MTIAPMDDDLMRIVMGETGSQSRRLGPPNYNRARRRLRALLAVARAARADAGNFSRYTPVRRRLDAALARLEKASKP